MAMEQASRQGCEALLLRELNHRMANTLAWASARLRLELRRPGDLDTRAILSRHERLLADFGALHRCLAIGAHGGMIALADYFPAFAGLLCRAVLAPIGARCELSVCDIWLDADRCEKLALIVAELVMNAAKYAFAEGDDGCVRIAIESRRGGILCRIMDNGCGGKLVGAGMGTQILSSLVGYLDGRIASRSASTGTEFVVWMPVYQEMTVSSQS